MAEQIKETYLNRSAITTLIDNNQIQTSSTSGSISTMNYRNFVLYLDIDSTGAPTDLVFEVQFSDDNVNFYKLTDHWYGDLRYEDVATASRIRESMGYYIQGRYVRLVATVTGGSATAYFTVTAKIEFYN